MLEDLKICENLKCHTQIPNKLRCSTFQTVTDWATSVREITVTLTGHRLLHFAQIFAPLF